MPALNHLIQSKTSRLTQLFLATEALLVFEILHRALMADAQWMAMSITALAACAITPVWFLLKQERLHTATVWLTASLTLLISTLMWHYGGLADESVFGYPCVLMVVALMGYPRWFWLLFSVMVGNMLTLGIATDQGWFVPHLPHYGLDSALLLCLILALISYAVGMLLRDLNRLVLELHNENLRVRASEQQISQLVNHDALTGLPNRTLARRFYESRLDILRPDERIALLFMDLDNFKQVNDTYGHHIGDFLLQTVAQRLQQVLRTSDMVCRISGDEFMLVIPALPRNSDLLGLVKKIQTALQHPLATEQHTIYPASSVGIALAPDHSTDFDQLSRFADLAMYQAKQSGSNQCHVYHYQMNGSTEPLTDLVRALAGAIRSQQLMVLYQPIMQLPEQRICGIEALLRWKHPQLGLIPPQDFIPLAEEKGLMDEIGQWVLLQACCDCQQWRQLCGDDLGVTINVTASQLSSADLITYIKDALQISQLPPALLTLDLPAQVLLSAEKYSGSLQQLRQLGVHFALDDFGQGFCQLSHLGQHDICCVKLDRSLIRDIMQSPAQQSLLSSVLQFADNMQLSAVVKGVEDIATLHLLQELGCRHAQGYLWSPALPLNDLTAFAKRRDADAS